MISKMQTRLSKACLVVPAPRRHAVIVTPKTPRPFDHRRNILAGSNPLRPPFAASLQHVGRLGFTVTQREQFQWRLRLMAAAISLPSIGRRFFFGEQLRSSEYGSDGRDSVTILVLLGSGVYRYGALNFH